MGIKGLTTFVKSKSEYCLEPYELHDTKVVIDGDAVLCQLYLSHTDSRNGCFGGDYDKYGNTIYKFFHLLHRCKVTPYVVLDGGYESRKMERILERFKNRIDQVINLNPRTVYANKATPIFMREVFEDIALKLDITLIRCDFEGDRATANIAKILKCPVISNDSDFYIFDVPYIPFPTVIMTLKDGMRSISCQIYKIDKFLSCMGGMRKENLPLFAALVGNDFMEGIDLSKLGINPTSNHYFQRIEAIIEWLLSETKNSAIEKILNIYENGERDLVNKKIEDAINGYSFCENTYLKYLEGNSSEVTEYTKNLEDEYNTYEKLLDTFPQLFIENFRKSLYPTRFMDILTQNKYYNFKPQVEVIDYEHAQVVSYDIIAAIHKILTGSTKNLVCLIRLKSDVSEVVLPLCNLDLPNFQQIQTMLITDRQKLIFKILNINEKFMEKSLTSFPGSWHLLIITLKYLIDKSFTSWPVVYSVIFCKLIIDYVDPKIGFFRSGDTYYKQYYNQTKNILANRKALVCNSKSLRGVLDSISYEDSVIIMSRMIPYFELDKRLQKYIKYYDRKLMHLLSQFQSCLLHVKYLNQLLNKPYPELFTTECFNGTFIYNFSSSLGRKDNLDDYVKYLLHNAPVMLTSFKMIVQLIKDDGVASE